MACFVFAYNYYLGTRPLEEGYQPLPKKSVCGLLFSVKLLCFHIVVCSAISLSSLILSKSDECERLGKKIFLKGKKASSVKAPEYFLWV